MKIALKRIKIEEKKILKQMLEDYEQELTGEKNPPEYKYLDLYWEREGRIPFFIVADDIISGFALVNKHVLVNSDGYNIAEFYIKNGLRKKGIGKNAVYIMFNLFPGKWENRQLASNSQARLFWKKIINEYTKGHYQEVWLDDDRWHGSIQTFDMSNISV